MIYEYLEWTCTLVGLIAFLHRMIYAFPNKTDPAAIALSIYFLSSFLSFAVGLDAITPYFAVFDFRNITIILSHASVIILTVAQQVVLMYWAHPPDLARRQARKRIIAYSIALALLITIFLLILPEQRQGTSETSSLLNLHNPHYALYLVLFVTATAIGQMVALRGSLQYAKVAHSRWLRCSMWTVTVGAMLILVYSTMRLTQIVGVQMGVNMAPWNPAQWISGDIGSLLELLGLTAPGWGPWLSTRHRWIRNIHYFHRLRPLWAALYEAAPEIALHAPRSRIADLMILWDIDYRLYRRLIEIFDGELVLRPHFDPAVAEAAVRRAHQSGSTGDRLRATVEAIQLHAALHAKANDMHRPSNSEISKISNLSYDLADETKRLVLVSDAFVSSVVMADTIIEACTSRRT
jgi:hypothetical protein